MLIALVMTRSLALATIASGIESVAPHTFDADVMVAENLPVSSLVPYMTTAIPVCKDGISSATARPHRKYHLKTARELTTAVVKEDDVLDVREAAESSHL